MSEDPEIEPAKGQPAKPEVSASSWWQTMPGMLTAIAGMITAIAGLVVALNQAGIFPIARSAKSPDLPPAEQGAAAQSFGGSAEDSGVPEATTPAQKSSALVLPDGMEAAIPIQADGTAVYKIISAQLAPFNAESRVLKLTIRCSNNARYPMNFWGQSFRLQIEGVLNAPLQGPNEVVEAQSAKAGEVTFTVPLAAQSALLKIGDPGHPTTEIPFDFGS